MNVKNGWLIVWVIASFLAACGSDTTPDEPIEICTDCGDADVGQETDVAVDLGSDSDTGSIACDENELMVDQQCVPCSVERGTLFDQTIDVDGESRAYLLHVPTDVRCDEPAPLWVHFHGTAGAMPERAYNLDATIEAADSAGAILVRPRSRSSIESGSEVFRWDQNAGDIEKNMSFTRLLVENVSTRYRVSDTVRVASGFSSGSNMSAVFLTEPDSPFTRLAPLAGGLWSRPMAMMRADSGVQTILLSSGTRDYLYGPAAAMLQPLSGLGIDAVLIPSASGHEFHVWEIDEIASRLLADEATLPDVAPFALHVVEESDGALLTAMSDGTLVRHRDGAPAEVVAMTSVSTPFVDGCSTGGRAIFTTLNGFVLVEENNPGPFVIQPWPMATHSIFGVPYQMGLGCSATTDEVMVVGYWGAAFSSDAGQSWTQETILSNNFAAQVADVVHTGTDWVSFGYYNANRGVPGSMAPIPHFPEGWYNGAAVDMTTGDVELVGNHGIRVQVQGMTLTPITEPSIDDDLYDVIDCLGARYYAGRRGVYKLADGTAQQVHLGFSSRLLCTLDGPRVFGDADVILTETQ